MKRIEGRHGEPTEFVEFQLQTKDMNYVAQRDRSGFWNVFEVTREHSKASRFLESFTTKEDAVTSALKLATLIDK